MLKIKKNYNGTLIVVQNAENEKNTFFIPMLPQFEFEKNELFLTNKI